MTVTDTPPVATAEEFGERLFGALRRYARDAGFADIEVLPMDDMFFRFYRLG